MQLIVTVADDAPDVNVTEAGIDVFVISDQPILQTESNGKTGDLKVYPNPAQDKTIPVTGGIRRNLFDCNANRNNCSFR